MRSYNKLPPVLDGFPDFSPKVIPREELTDEQWKLKKQREEERRSLVPLFRTGLCSRAGLSLPYRLFVPDDISSSARYPLVLFLHGGGERGTDNTTQLVANDGACVWVREQLAGRQEKCFVLAPQCPDGERGFLEKHLLAVSEMLDDICSLYPIDADRIYVTGLSMGGGGCWRIQYMYPGRFTGMLALCCAACTVENKAVDMSSVQAAAGSFRDTPIWLVQSEDDPAVNPDCPRTFFKILRSISHGHGSESRYTEYPAALNYKHNVWDAAYANDDMRAWLLSRRK